MTRNPSHNWNPGETSTVDPPAVEAIGGDGGDRAPVELAVVDEGFYDGFSNRQELMKLTGSAWQIVAGNDGGYGNGIEELGDLQDQLDAFPHLAGPMMLGTIVRLRAALDQIPRDILRASPPAARPHPAVVTDLGRPRDGF